MVLYRVQTGIFIALIAINAIIIPYKISINNCSIKMQIVIILRKTLNLTTQMSTTTNKTKNCKLLYASFSELSNFSALSI